MRTPVKPSSATDTQLDDELDEAPLPESSCDDRGFLFSSPLQGSLRGRSPRLRYKFRRYLPSQAQLLWGLILLAGFWIYRNAEKTMPLVKQDVGVLLTANEVANWTGAFEFDPAFETVTKTRDLMGRYELRYEYACEADDMSMNVVVSVERSEEAARDAYLLTNVTTVIDWNLDPTLGVGLIEQHESFDWGDELRAFLVEVDGVPIGNSFSGRLGNKTVYMAVRGISFERGVDFAILLESVLQKLEGYSPE
jgi:hypothetical protein